MTARTIAIDGPASSGKGTAARAVARALGHAYVDTGAIYRSVAWAARRRGVSWDDPQALGALAGSLDIGFAWDGERLVVTVDGEDVTDRIRTGEMGTGASAVSRHPSVRDALLALQRDLADQGGVVMDGRDIGTVVLPDAQLKVYLDASVDERARRRHAELRARGEEIGLEVIRKRIEARDRQDRERAVAPLRIADDAVVVDSTGRSPAEVVAEVIALARARG